MVCDDISLLVEYGMEKNLFERSDSIYITNKLLDVMDIDDYVPAETNMNSFDLESVLKRLCDYALDHGLIPDDRTVTYDLFDTKLMGCLVPPPSTVINRFNELYSQTPKLATDYFYSLSRNSNYIRTYRTAKDIKWKYKSKYGDLIITVNLAKPEKDPRDIAAARTQAVFGYPKCLLCKESEGYRGRNNYPARQNHRIIPIMLGGTQWGFQYSPYVYYNEHCIVLNCEHIPMKISRLTFERLLEFTERFPHYFIGSNADLPIVGGSILTHDHFQGGAFTFPMATAKIESHFHIEKYKEIIAGIVDWPMSVIRLRHSDRKLLADAAEYITECWRGYSDAQSSVIAYSDGEPHNTVTPIARRVGDDFEFDIVLRNNIKTAEHPMGLFHPHSELHHIKKENIGLIEVMGLAVLPSRLKSETERLAEALINNEKISDIPDIAKHSDWAEYLKTKYSFGGTSEETKEILKAEIGAVFEKVLEHAGIYKRNTEGRAGFGRFINFLNKQ